MPQQEPNYLLTDSQTPEDLLIEHATHVLESEERAKSWILEPNPALGRRTPLEMVNSKEERSAEEVYALLRRIEYGNYS